MSPRALRIVFTILFAFFVVTGLFPSVLLIVVLFTFGLGFPLLFLNTVFLYFLAALPAFVALNRRPRSWSSVALAALFIPAVAIVPSILTRLAATSNMEQLRANDAEIALPETPKTVEIVGEQRFYGGENSVLKNAPCDTLCQRLLLGRSIDLVRVTRNRAVGPVPAVQLDYRIEQRPSCPDAFGDGDTVLPQAKNAVASGVCFIARPVDATIVNTRISIRKTTTPPPQNLAQDVFKATGAVKEIQRLEISTSESGKWTTRFRKTQIQFSHWRLPTMLVFADCYGMCVGYPVFARTDEVLNPFDPDQAVLDALKIKSSGDARTLDPAARVMALLDHAGEALTDNQRLLINDWAQGFPCTHKGCAPTSARDKDVLLRLIKDRRVTDLVFVGSVISRNPEFVVANLDLLLEEMEARGASSSFSNNVGAIVASLGNELLRSRRDRILALIRTNDWKWSRGIGIVVGRLGVDTASLISQRLRDPVSARTAALAACLADEAVGRALVPALLAYLTGLPTTNNFPDEADRDVVKALARFGHFDEAKEIYLSRFPKLGDHSLPRQSAADVVKDVNACYRG